jgi:hypothetical protein
MVVLLPIWRKIGTPKLSLGIMKSSTDDTRPKDLVASASAPLLQLLSFYRFFVAVTVSSRPSHPDIVIFGYSDIMI